MITKQTRISYRLPSSGPYLATVVNHLDPTYMGGLEVSIIKGYTNDPSVKSQSFVVRYLSPFYGVTREGAKSRPNWKEFKDTQSSYGMWMIPPDIGTTVICFFVEGDTQNGFWIGCVQETFQNFMIPGIAASEFPENQMTEDQRRRYGTTYLPSAEFNKDPPADTYNANVLDPSKKIRPIHPFAERLIEQGLLLDKVRGVTSSSARREVPSAVFGISTPGPLDKTTGTRDLIGDRNKQVDVPLNRLGGSSFVMDDGDINGDNELVRIRTRTGHQILLHNTADLIYIANSKGTAWIELTSQGKIDIFAQDSVSIHSQADFNFRADRDINLEAGRSMRISARDMELEVIGNRKTNIIGDDLIFVDGTTNLTSNLGMKFSTLEDFNLKSNNMNLQSILQTNMLSGGSTKITAPSLSLNGAPASLAVSATLPTRFQKFELPATDGAAIWSDQKFYNNGSITSIMQRVPMHEPWSQHESNDPGKYSVSNTDANQATSTSANQSLPENPNQPKDWYKDNDFINKVKEVAAKQGVDYIDLLAVMHFETGGLMNANTTNNAGGSAIGLIQFTRPAIDQINNNSEKKIDRMFLARLTRTEQMTWVDKYFDVTEKWKKLPNQYRDIDSLYMAVLSPNAVGKEDDYIIFRSNTLAYNQNRNLDVNRNGSITKSEAASFPKQRIPTVKRLLGVT
jgi:hypothetical protein